MSHTYLTLLYDLHIVAQLYDIVAHLSNIAANPFHNVILLPVIIVHFRVKKSCPMLFGYPRQMVDLYQVNH